MATKDEFYYKVKEWGIEIYKKENKGDTQIGAMVYPKDFDKTAKEYLEAWDMFDKYRGLYQVKD